MKHMSKGYRFFRVINTIIMLLMIFITAYPMFYCVMASFSDPGALMRYRGMLWKPLDPFTLDAYRAVFRYPLLLSGFKNTVIVMTVGTVLNLALTALTAYPLSRKGLMLNKPLTMFFMFTMYFSGGMIPGYLNIRDLGLLDNRWALILPGAMSVYNMIILRTAFSAIPDSLEESARIEGANHFTVMTKVMIPLVKPTLAVLTLYYGVSFWNAWFSTHLYIQDDSKKTLQLITRNILNAAELSAADGVTGDEMSSYMVLMKYALIVVTTVPILTIYPFLQKYFVKGTMLGAVKE